MKIITFQYNKSASAIIRGDATRREKGTEINLQLVNHCMTNSYEDWLLWEEAASLRLGKNRDYAILGVWQ